MLRRTPMPRGTGFKRATSAPAGVRPERVTKWPIALAERAKAAIQTIAQTCSASPKENVAKSAAYEAAVRRLPCYRCGIVGFTQFCHTDEGKGQGIKTDVRLGWPGCRTREGEPGCHWFIGTSGTLPREEKRQFEEKAAAHTRAEVERRGWWPKKLPKFEQKAQPALHTRAPAAINSGAA